MLFCFSLWRCPWKGYLIPWRTTLRKIAKMPESRVEGRLCTLWWWPWSCMKFINLKNILFHNILKKLRNMDETISNKKGKINTPTHTHIYIIMVFDTLGCAFDRWIWSEDTMMQGTTSNLDGQWHLLSACWAGQQLSTIKRYLLSTNLATSTLQSAGAPTLYWDLTLLPLLFILRSFSFFYTLLHPKLLCFSSKFSPWKL